MPNLFPTFDVPTVSDTALTDSEQYPYAVYFDFYKGDFIVSGEGTIISASPEEAWREWCLKVINTERDSLLAYSTNTGTELIDAFAHPTRKAQESAIEKTITEALLSDPLGRTTMVSDFVHVWGTDSLQTTMTVTGRNTARAIITANITI